VPTGMRAHPFPGPPPLRRRRAPLTLYFAHKINGASNAAVVATKGMELVVCLCIDSCMSSFTIYARTVLVHVLASQCIDVLVIFDIVVRLQANCLIDAIVYRVDKEFVKGMTIGERCLHCHEGQSDQVCDIRKDKVYKVHVLRPITFALKRFIFLSLLMLHMYDVHAFMFHVPIALHDVS
jgi:hypothetical protein